MFYLKAVYKQAFLLLFFLVLVLIGVSEGQYELVMWDFVRVVCRSCIGIG